MGRWWFYSVKDVNDDLCQNTVECNPDGTLELARPMAERAVRLISIPQVAVSPAGLQHLCFHELRYPNA